MKNIFFTILLNLVICFANAQTPSSAEPCDNILTKRLSGSREFIFDDIKKSGNYCLNENIKNGQPGYIFAEGRFASSAGNILKVSASNVNIDLKGYMLHGMSGITGGRFTKKIENAKKGEPSVEYIGVKNIHIKNGTIYMDGLSVRLSTLIKGLSYSSLLHDFEYTSLNIDKVLTSSAAESAKEELQKSQEKLNNLRADFPKSENILENLKITTEEAERSPAVGLQGAGNIIRNSTIEVTDGMATVYLFGPNQLIENNIIIFKGKASTPSSAPIKIHLADNSIIRNNIIIIDSFNNKKPVSAVSIIDSKNVVLENNRIYGTNALWKAWDEVSSVKESDTKKLTFRPAVGNKVGVQ